MDVGAGRGFPSYQVLSITDTSVYNPSRLSLMKNWEFYSCSFEQETKNITEDTLVFFPKVYFYLFHAI